MAKIVQMLSHGGRLYVLDDKGVMWTRSANEAKGGYYWEKLAPPSTLDHNDEEGG